MKLQHRHVKSTISQICHGKVDHRWVGTSLSSLADRPFAVVVNDAAMLRGFNDAEQQDVPGDVQIRCVQHRRVQLLRFSFSYLITEAHESLWECLLFVIVFRSTTKTYCDIASHKVWDLIVCWIDNNVEGHMRRTVFPIRHTEHELVDCGLHPLVSGLHIVHLTVNDVFERKGGCGKREQKNTGNLFLFHTGDTTIRTRYIPTLTYAYARVTFLKARTWQDIFNVTKLGWRNQTDHQFIQDGVHVRGLQMRRSYRGSSTFIHQKDVSYEQIGKF